MLNRHILIISFLIFSSAVNAQELVFSKSAGSDTVDSELDQGHAITIDDSGNSYITGIMSNWTTGSIFGNGEANQTTLTINGAFIAKYDPDGSLIWAKEIDANNNGISSNAVALDNDNNVYITGRFSNAVTFGVGTTSQTTYNSNGGMDVFFAKYSQDGDFLWAKTFGGSNADNPGGKGIIIDANQNIYLTGAINDVVVFGAGETNETTINANDLDIFLAKYDIDGNLIWVKHAGGPNNDNAKDIDLDSLGNIYITGNFFSSVIFAKGLTNEVNLTAGNEAAFIAKYDTNGELIWAQSPYLQAGVNIGNAIKVVTDDRIVFTGGFYSVAVLTDCVSVTATSEDMILIQFDGEGNYIWNTVISSNMDDRGVALAVDTSNHIFVTGYIGNDVLLNDGQCREVFLSNKGSGDLYIATYDINGQLLTATSAGSSNWDQASGIAVNNSGDIHITGFYRDNIVFGPSEINETILLKNGFNEIFVAKYHLDLSIGEDLPYAGENNCLDLCQGMSPIDLFDSLLENPDTGGTWSPSLTSGTGVFDPSIDAEGVYRYEVLDSNCISDFAEITISLNNQGNPGQNNTLSICISDAPINLFDNLGGNPDTGGVWSPSLTSGSGVFDPNFDPSGIYVYTIGSVECGLQNAEIEVNLIAAPNPGINNFIEVCPTETAINLFESLGGNPDIGGVWSPGLLSGSGVFDPAVDTAGIYLYTIESDNCGPHSAEIEVRILNPINPGLNGTVEICLTDAPLNLFESLEGDPNTGGIWSPSLSSGTGIFNPNTDPFGVYIYTITDNCGTDSAEVSIGLAANCDIIQSIQNVMFPKFFTPNGDGYHDYWQIGGDVNSAVTKIYIFDRYGKLLKQLNPQNQGWDGKYRGHLLAATDYWFTATLDNGTTFTGHFSLKL